MKHLILFAFSMTLSLSLLAQQPAKTTPKPVTKPVTKTATKPATSQVPPKKILTTLNDSASYAVGFIIANGNKQQGLPPLNTALVTRGCTDMLEDKPTLLTEPVANDVLNRYTIQVQKSKTTPAAVPKVVNNPAPKSGPLKTLRDSASYAIGIRYGGFYKQYGIAGLNAPLIKQACDDVSTNKKALVNDVTTNQVMNAFVMQIQEEKAEAVIKAGKAFLDENAKKPGVKTTASGLQYEPITEGTGVKPTAADSVTCHYKGTFIDGTEFDASYKHGGPITFALGGVIRGWTEGLQLMSVGSKYKFYVPYDLAYGAFDRPGIPGGSTLIFEVELLNVKKQ